MPSATVARHFGGKAPNSTSSMHFSKRPWFSGVITDICARAKNIIASVDSMARGAPEILARAGRKTTPLLQITQIQTQNNSFSCLINRCVFCDMFSFYLLVCCTPSVRLHATTYTHEPNIAIKCHHSSHHGDQVLYTVTTFALTEPPITLDSTTSALVLPQFIQPYHKNSRTHS